MPEEQNPIKLFDSYDFSVPPLCEYSNGHVITHTVKDLTITFGKHYPPNLKTKPIAQIILTEHHAMELVINLQIQLASYRKTRGEPTSPGGRF